MPCSFHSTIAVLRQMTSQTSDQKPPRRTAKEEQQWKPGVSFASDAVDREDVHIIAVVPNGTLHESDVSEPNVENPTGTIQRCIVIKQAIRTGPIRVMQGHGSSSHRCDVCLGTHVSGLLLSCEGRGGTVLDPV